MPVVPSTAAACGPDAGLSRGGPMQPGADLNDVTPIHVGVRH